MKINFSSLADDVLAGQREVSQQEALAMLALPDAEILSLVEAASRLRRRYFSNKVKVNYLINLKSGLCPEDCSYCSQRLGSQADILKYSWIDPDHALDQARAARAAGAARVCLVASGRGPRDRDVDRVSRMIQKIKTDQPELEICACLGILKEGQAQGLGRAGATAYNHNINSSSDYYQKICSTHSFNDRTKTVEEVQASGLSACSGLIAGMGESDQQLVSAVFTLKELEVDSIPVNFLLPFEGTPLAGQYNLTALKCLKILAMVRMVNPDREIRLAAGREEHLGSLQGLGLHLANSLFIGDYLTPEGQEALDDLQMIYDGGFEILGAEERDLLAEHRQRIKTYGSQDRALAGPVPDKKTAQTLPVPTPRKRGTGTDLKPNA